MRDRPFGTWAPHRQVYPLYPGFILHAKVPTSPSLPARPASSTPDGQVHVLSVAEALATYAGEWQDLADRAIEPNVFYEPWMLGPAAGAFGNPDTVWLVLVCRQPKGPPKKGQKPMVTGLFPLEQSPPRPRMPMATLGLWRHKYCFLSAPLVRRGHEQETLGAFFDWLAQHDESVGLLDLDRVPGDGPLHQYMLDELNRRGWLTAVNRRWTRALLRPAERDVDAYLGAALSGKRRKELRRQRRRLAEGGAVEIAQLAAPGSAAVDAFVDGFMELEAAGWKGEAQTAFRDQPADVRFLRQITREAHGRGRLMATELRLDGRPIAAKLNFLAGRGGFAFKIAFDETFARYSPGVLLEIDTIERVCADEGIQWMDSCAKSDHPMINHLWTERRTLEQLLVSPGRRRGDLALALMPAARLFSRTLQAWRRPLATKPR